MAGPAGIPTPLAQYHSRLTGLHSRRLIKAVPFPVSVIGV